MPSKTTSTKTAQKTSIKKAPAKKITSNNPNNYVLTLIIVGILAAFSISLSGFNAFVNSQLEKELSSIKETTEYVQNDVDDIYLSLGQQISSSSNIDIREPSPSERWLGEEDARYVWIVFSDLQCPYCSILHPVIEDLQEKRSNELAIVFRHLPLENLHAGSINLSIASECVAKDYGNDKFWDFVNGVFAEDIPADLSSLPNYVDADKLQNCIDSKSTLPKVSDDYSEAVKLGVNSTPTNFLYDTVTKKATKASGSMSLDDAEALLNNFIKRTK